MELTTCPTQRGVRGARRRVGESGARPEGQAPAVEGNCEDCGGGGGHRAMGWLACCVRCGGELPFKLRRDVSGELGLPDGVEGRGCDVWERGYCVWASTWRMGCSL